MSRLNSLTPPPPPHSQTMATEEPPKNVKRVLQNRIWESLSELCQKMDNLENKPFRLGLPAPGSTLDVSTSFLRTEKDYDWFDLDKDGGIIVQPKVPMFPEDFPPGQPLHPLSWWGIVDPALGERKNPKVVTASGVERVVEKKPEVRKRSRSAEREHVKPLKKRSKSRSRDRNDDSVSQRNKGRQDLHRRSPNSFEKHHRHRNGPPPPPPPRREDAYSGPPRDDWNPGHDERRMSDRRPVRPPGGDRGGYSDNVQPTLVERRHYPDDRGRYGGIRHHDEPPRRDDRGRSDRARY